MLGGRWRHGLTLFGAMARVTSLQRQFAGGCLVLPVARPASVSERAWTVLVRHVRDRVTYAALAAELGISDHGARQLAAQAAAALQYPELADLPGDVRHVLVAGGYTTRQAVAEASDADLLGLRGMRAARLRLVREVIPRVEWSRPHCPAWRLYGPLRAASRPRLGCPCAVPLARRLPGVPSPTRWGRPLVRLRLRG